MRRRPGRSKVTRRGLPVALMDAEDVPLDSSARQGAPDGPMALQLERYFEAVNPESAIAFSRSARFALESSYLTTTWFFSRSAEAVWTPCTDFSLASVFAGHFSHFQPFTLMVSVLTPAKVAVLKPRAIANANDAVFMFPPKRLPARSYVAWRPFCQPPALGADAARHQRIQSLRSRRKNRGRCRSP